MPHVLVYAFGPILGFTDVYFRGSQALGAEGYLVMKVVADPEDIIGALGSGPVLLYLKLLPPWHASARLSAVLSPPLSCGVICSTEKPWSA
jgi:hypothetical protein